MRIVTASRLYRAAGVLLILVTESIMLYYYLAPRTWHDPTFRDRVLDGIDWGKKFLPPGVFERWIEPDPPKGG